jgi:ribosome maturation factor RimP
MEVGVQRSKADSGHHDIEDRIARLAAPIAESLGVSLVRVRYQGTRTSGALRLTVDKPGGVTLDDCTRLSRALGHALDVEEPIDHRYTLEVSSPGLDRPLEDRRDFEQAVGRLARVKTRPSWDGPRLLIGRLKGVEPEAVRIEEGEDGREWSVPWDAIAQARLEIEW